VLTDKAQERQQALDVVHFKKVLSDNSNQIRAAISPHFYHILCDVPALSEHHRSLRIKYNNDPDSAISDFLDMVSVSNDKVVWVQFLQALDSRLISYRRQFVSDEEWSGRSLVS